MDKAKEITRMKNTILELHRTRPADCDLNDEVSQFSNALETYTKTVKSAQDRCYDRLKDILEAMEKKCPTTKK